jgi:hypothetical protein
MNTYRLERTTTIQLDVKADSKEDAVNKFNNFYAEELMPSLLKNNQNRGLKFNISSESVVAVIPEKTKKGSGLSKTIALLQQDFQSSSGCTDQWRKFALTFKRELNKVIELIGGSNLDFHRGHFYCSGFFTDANNNIWYFSISDVRFFNDKRLMIREALNYKDYTGGANNYILLDKNFTESLKSITR